MFYFHFEYSCFVVFRFASLVRFVCVFALDVVCVVYVVCVVVCLVCFVFVVFDLFHLSHLFHMYFICLDLEGGIPARQRQ